MATDWSQGNQPDRNPVRLHRSGSVLRMSLSVCVCVRVPGPQLVKLDMLGLVQELWIYEPVAVALLNPVVSISLLNDFGCTL